MVLPFYIRVGGGWLWVQNPLGEFPTYQFIKMETCKYQWNIQVVV